MIEPNVQLIPSQFHWDGREGHTPKWLIIHGTAGGLPATTSGASDSGRKPYVLGLLSGGFA